MQVTVVDLEAPTRHDVVEASPDPDCRIDTILYIPVPAALEPSKLVTALHDIDSAVLRSTELVVLRLHAPAARVLLDDLGLARRVHQRLERRPTLVLHWEDDVHRLTPMADGVDEQSPDADWLLQMLRQAEFEMLLRQPGVVLPAIDALHYEGPNGDHYRSFVRVGTAVQGVEKVDAIDFWLLPTLIQQPILLLDSWTIVSIGLNLTGYLDRSGLAALRPAAVEAQRAYDEWRTTLKSRLERLRSQLDDDPPPVVILVSVASTGTLARELRLVCERAGLQVSQVIGLYASSEDVADETFCVYEGIGEHHPSATCPWCQMNTTHHSPSVRVEPTTYMLELSAAVETTRVTRAVARPARQFFDRYKGSNCFSIHRQQHDNSRHHMIHVDAERLSAHPTFKERLATKVEAMPRPDLVLAPRHGSAVTLAHQVSQLLGLDPVIADQDGLDEISVSERDQLRDAERVLLVDDVVVTGSRVRSYRHYLRTGGFLSEAHPDKLNFLVAVARPPTTDILRSIIEMLHGEEQFHEVERLLLPNWERDRCPWCWEQEMLEAMDEAVAANARLATRLDALRRSDRGLHRELFLPWSTEADAQPVSTFEIGPDSIFTTTTDVELFVSVTSAMQALRSARKLDERFTVPLSKVLQPEFVENRYYDAGIYAAILRAAQRHDLRGAVKTEPELAEMVRMRLGNDADRGLRAELILAMSRGILPLLPEVLQQGGVLDEVNGTPQIRQTLRRALER